MGIDKKIVLDSYFIDKICERYNIPEDSKSVVRVRLEHWSCFSDPDLDQHVCNHYARVNGSRCNYCQNNEALIFDCYKVCTISHICISAYANRLKGGFDPEYFERLLTVDYDELLSEVENLKEGGLSLFKEGGEEEPEKEIPEVKEEIVEELIEEIEDLEKQEEDVTYVTVKEASDFLGVSVPTMYNYVKKGKVEAIKDKKVKISIKSLKELKGD